MSEEQEIWVVDDDEAVREGLVELVQSNGFPRVLAFATGATAWTALAAAAHAPAMIILDREMPQMDGAAFRKLQLSDPRFRDIPVVMFTAAPPVAMPGVLVISKGTDPQMLVTVLQRLASPLPLTPSRSS